MAGRFATFVNLLKTNIGTGILALPAAFKEAGLIGGTVGLILIAVVCVHTIHVLMNVAVEMERRSQKKGLDYEDVAEEVLRFGPKIFRKYATLGKLVLLMFLIVTQFGYCTVYILFSAENLAEFFKAVAGWNYSLQSYLACLLPLMVIICFMNKMEHFAIVSTIAIIFQVVGLGIIFWEISQNLPPISSRNMFVSIKRFPLFFGTCVSTLEGIAVILPLRIAMKEPQALGGWFGILNIGMGLVVVSYVAMGFLGYLKYGEKLNNVITLMLPSSFIFVSIKLLYGFAIFFTYPLQFCVGFWFFWPWVRERYFEGQVNMSSTVFQYILKTFLVSLTFLIAAVVPHVTLIIDLMGSVLGCYLCLIFPPLFEILAYWETRKTITRWNIILAKDIVVIIIGFCAFVTGTYFSVYELSLKLNQDKLVSSNRTNVAANVTAAYHG